MSVSSGGGTSSGGNSSSTDEDTGACDAGRSAIDNLILFRFINALHIIDYTTKHSFVNGSADMHRPLAS